MFRIFVILKFGGWKSCCFVLARDLWPVRLSLIIRRGVLVVFTSSPYFVSSS